MNWDLFNTMLTVELVPELSVELVPKMAIFTFLFKTFLLVKVLSIKVRDSIH